MRQLVLVQLRTYSPPHILMERNFLDQGLEALCRERTLKEFELEPTVTQLHVLAFNKTLNDQQKTRKMMNQENTSELIVQLIVLPNLKVSKLVPVPACS